ALRTRTRNAATSSRDVRPVHPWIASMKSAPRFPNLFPQDEEKLEPPEEEVETPSPMLPHRRRRSIVVAKEDNRVDRLEPPLEQSEQAEPHGSIRASPVRVCDGTAEAAP